MAEREGASMSSEVKQVSEKSGVTNTATTRKYLQNFRTRRAAVVREFMGTVLFAATALRCKSGCLRRARRTSYLTKINTNGPRHIVCQGPLHCHKPTTPVSPSSNCVPIKGLFLMIGRLCAVGCTTVFIGVLSGCVGLTGSAGNQPPPNPGLQKINHIVFLAQENRSFDSYFGAMRGYWAAKGVQDQPFDGLPQFNPPAGSQAAPTNPGCDPAFPFIPPSTNLFCQVDAASPLVTSFHFASQCVENVSPSWNEAHHDWNLHQPTSSTFMGDGFVDTAANFARQHMLGPNPAPFFDVNGNRAMGYYDWTDLNYYYQLATDFATSDTWFAPVMSRTPPNRDYMVAATSHGYAYQVGSNPPLNSAQIPVPTIFEELAAAGISWKIYIPTQATRCASNPTVTCLLNFTYIHDFKIKQTILANPGAYTQNLVPLSQYFTDAINGTLPQVALIEPASNAHLDE